MVSVLSDGARRRPGRVQTIVAAAIALVLLAGALTWSVLFHNAAPLYTANPDLAQRLTRADTALLDEIARARQVIEESTDLPWDTALVAAAVALPEPPGSENAHDTPNDTQVAATKVPSAFLQPGVATILTLWAALGAATDYHQLGIAVLDGTITRVGLRDYVLRDTTGQIVSRTVSLTYVESLISDIGRRIDVIQTAEAEVTRAWAEVKELAAGAKAELAAELAQAKSDYEIAVSNLDDAIGGADTYLTETEGKVSDQAVWQALRDRLDDALRDLAADVDTDSIADVLPAAAALQGHLEAINSAVGGLSASHDEWIRVENARRQAEEAAKAAPPPAINAEGIENGRLPDAALCPIPYAAGQRLACRAAATWDLLNQAFRAEFGHDVPISQGYRTYDEQVDAKERYGGGAATPGQSMHGWGLAIDIADPGNGSGGKEYWYGTPKYEWLKEHGPTYGWVAPDWALETGTLHEPWHFEYSGF